MVCSRTLYREAWAGNLPIEITELPEAIKRKRTQSYKPRETRSTMAKALLYGQKLHLNAQKKGIGKAIRSLTNDPERNTENYIAFLIPGKTSEAVMSAMHILKAEFGDHFGQVFKTVTVDNGSEFADFAQCESWGTQVFFAHPYTSWERAQNERYNGLYRAYVPKNVSLQNYSAEYILASADELNARPRKKLGMQHRRSCSIPSLTGSMR